MEEIVFKPIGVIRTPFVDVEGMPVQPMGARGVKGEVRLNTDLEPGLKDLDGFSHVMLIYCFHLSSDCSLHVLPFLDRTPHGVFATRVPSRPNGIGVSVVKLTGIRGAILDIEEVDVVDGTPLLDIKPFVPKFDNRETERAGWFTKRADNATVVRADKRFRREPDAVAESKDLVTSFTGTGATCGQQGISPAAGPCESCVGGQEDIEANSRVRVSEGKGRGVS